MWCFLDYILFFWIIKRVNFYEKDFFYLKVHSVGVVKTPTVSVEEGG